MAGNFKPNATPTPAKPPKAIPGPLEKAGLPAGGYPSTDAAQKASSPDGPRSGYSELPSGRRAYKDEIPFAPPVAPRKQWKETK